MWNRKEGRGGGEVRDWRKQQRNPGKRKQHRSHNILFISDLCVSIFIHWRRDSFWTIHHFCKMWQVVFHLDSLFPFPFSLPFQRPTDHFTKLSITSTVQQGSNFGCTGNTHTLPQQRSWSADSTNICSSVQVPILYTLFEAVKHDSCSFMCVWCTYLTFESVRV